MGKATEISVLYKEIKQQMGKLVSLCHEIESSAVDVDAVRKEAYEEGYKEGMQLSIDDAKLKESYRNGLNDAWEAARKITDMETEKRDKVFEETFTHRIFRQNTYSEAIEKIRQYEQEKEEIQVGDEVVGTYTGGDETEPFVIIRKIPEICPTYYFGIYSKSGEFCQGELKLKKTGRHFPEIAEVLQKMKESDNG